ncbi:uncharacterized protein LOC133033437 [Cannabis sativa]|uniref:uncharacterized protein LOC133033437 n=1 Tax=Cannabis sativa TaxID=3483 RepID=UPI0029CA07F5|nr:uncharacterized protein LOC133033437 [Cannabis sativa]
MVLLFYRERMKRLRLLILIQKIMEVCNILGWNVRGMNKKDKQRDILDVCRENKVGFAALFETKVKHQKVVDDVVNNFPNLEIFSSEIISRRILLLWQRKFVSVDILIEDPQLIHCKVRIRGLQIAFFVTAVYGFNSINERKDLWSKLQSLGQNVEPWVIFGDFNAMFRYNDRTGGNPVSAKDIEDAQQWLSNGEVEEFKCAGSHNTWSNKHDVGDRIYSKLDRVFTNSSWYQSFPNTDAIFKWDNVSDHMMGGWQRETKKEGLDAVNIKLLRVKHVLRRFSKDSVGDVTRDFKRAKEDLYQAQEALAKNPTDITLQQKEKLSQVTFTTTHAKYISYLRQQSKITWVRCNDENSNYFHASMRKRKLENRITTFSIGSHVEDDCGKVVNHFLNHFKRFMGSRSSVIAEIDLDCIQYGNLLDLEQQVNLIRRFTRKDVKKALFSIHSTKSPGLDGYGSGFFKALWNQIGGEVSSAILGFFFRMGSYLHSLMKQLSLLSLKLRILKRPLTLD